ncbi:MAG: amidohydrolase family protein [Acidimicrobiia bacterium]
MSKFLLRGGCVLTLGARTPNFSEADVLIDGDRIAEVGPGLRARDAEVVDAADTIVMPGFVDTHRHVWRSLSRNLGDGPSNQGEHYDSDDVYAATLIGLLGAVEAGITTVVDWSDVNQDCQYADAALQAHLDAGLRTVLVIPNLDVSRRLHKTVGTTATSVAFGATDSGSGENWAAARQLGGRIHTHAGMDPAESGQVAGFGGMLGPDVTLIHCTNLDDGDLDAISAAGAKVSLTPSSDMAGGMGSPPIQRIIDRRIRPGLGIDDEMVGPGDMFAQMRATISLQHATFFDLKLAGKAGLPNLLTTREVIRFGTIDGAGAIGLGSLTGSLEPGKQADVVMLRSDRPNIVPVNDPIGAVVWGMDTSNVDWVFAGGQALMRSGVLTADLTRARSLATTAQTRVSEAVALVAATGSGERP